MKIIQILFQEKKIFQILFQSCFIALAHNAEKLKLGETLDVWMSGCKSEFHSHCTNEH